MRSRHSSFSFFFGYLSCSKVSSPRCTINCKRAYGRVEKRAASPPASFSSRTFVGRSRRAMSFILFVSRLMVERASSCPLAQFYGDEGLDLC